jgi:hypothetical protein
MPRNREPMRSSVIMCCRASLFPEHRRGSQWLKSCGENCIKLRKLVRASVKTDPHRHRNSDGNICDSGCEKRGFTARSRGALLFIILLLIGFIVVRADAEGIGNNAVGPGRGGVICQGKAATGLGVGRSSLPSTGTATSRGCQVCVFTLGHIAVMCVSVTTTHVRGKLIELSFKNT